MKQYAVKVQEVLARTVIVTVNDDEDFNRAVDIVEGAYNNCDIVLEADDFVEKEFIPSETFGTDPISEDDDRLSFFETIKATEEE